MPGPLAEIVLFAQDQPKVGQAQTKVAGGKPNAAAPPESNGLLTFLPLVVVLMIYLVLFGGPRKTEKKRREMIDALKKNDRVMTTSGIFATVVSVSPESDRVVLRVDDDKGIKMEFSKAAISQVLNPEAEKEKPAAAAK
jgi:preprotein translocase subunit YajC